jgi:hypothetical protein
MKKVAVEDTTLTADELARLAEKEPVILTRGGQPLVAIKDLSGSDWETVSLVNNPQFIAIIEASRRSYRETGGIPQDQIREELGLKPRKVASTKPRRRKPA